MRRLLLILCLAFAVSLPLAAQFGLSVFYNDSQDDIITLTHPDGGSLGEGFEVAGDYWFRLRNKRIEFLPTVSYGRYAGEFTLGDFGQEGLVTTDYQFNEFGFQFKTNFYLFDFGTDCDCPTFGKQGPALHKGFYFQVAPGISYWQGKTVNRAPFEDDRSSNDNSFLPSLGLGVGLDFGISNLVTITPQVAYRFYFSDLDWDAIQSPCSLCDATPREMNISTLQAGIRLGIRLDERRY